MTSPANPADLADRPTTYRAAPIPQMSSLRAALTSEWTKLRSVRSTVWALVMTSAFTIGLGTLFCWAFVNRPRRRGFRDLLFFDATAQSLQGVLLAMLAVGTLGVLMMSSEFQTGMIRSSLAAVPSRSMLLIAKTIVLVTITSVVSLVSCLLAFFLGQAVLSSENLNVDIGDPSVLRAVLGASLFLTMIGLFGLAVGTVVRRTPGALSTLFGIVLIFPLLAQSLPDPWDEDIGKFSPLFAGQAMFSVKFDNDLLTAGQGVLVLLGWVVAFFIAAFVLVNRRDV